MNGKVVTGVIIVLIILFAGGYLVLNRNTANAPTATQTQPTQQTQASASASPSEAMASPSSAMKNEQNTVTLTANGWQPATLTIKAGEKVTWVNKSGEVATVNSNPHPTHTDYPPLNLGQFQNDASLSLTFTKPGTYGYHNHLNPSELGTIIVK